ERAAARLDLGLESAVGRASLGGKISRMSGLTLRVVVHLAGDEQDCLGAGDLDGLGVGGRVEHALGCKPFDLGCHDEISSEWGASGRLNGRSHHRRAVASEHDMVRCGNASTRLWAPLATREMEDLGKVVSEPFEEELGSYR